MIIFPAMDLWLGNVVKLDARRHRTVEVEYGSPTSIAARWMTAGAEWLHVVDLNAALGDGPSNLRVLGEPALRSPVAPRVQWGGGVRDDATLDAVLRAGAARVIVGTKAIEDWTWLIAASNRHPDRILVSIDGRGREIMIKGWQEKAGVDVVAFIEKANALPLAGYLYTNVAVEGRGRGVDWEPVKDVVRASAKPVVFSGGVTTLDEVGRFKDLGAFGIIIGSALYSNRIDFAAAKALAR